MARNFRSIASVLMMPVLMLPLGLATGCGEPKGPPPGVSPENSDTPATIDMPTDSPAAQDDPGAPTETSPEKESAGEAPGEK